MKILKKIPLIRPFITQEIKDRVCEVLDSGYLTEGPVTREFEECVKAYLGCRHVVATCNCTVGLEMALRALNLGPGDEVIVPDYTYPATASVIRIVGANIVLVDVNPQTMLMDYDALENAITSKTRAMIPVSIFGNPMDYDRLKQIKKKHGLYIVEDAACSMGAEYKGVKVGNQADITVFSLHPRKFITTGEGGLVSTNNPEWADWMCSYKHFGMGVHDSRLTSSFDRIGTNYKLSNILSAVGLVQMQHIDELLARRRAIAKTYIDAFADTPGIKVPEITNHGQHSFQSFCIFVDNRDRIIDALREKGIESQIGTYALHKHNAFKAGENCRITETMPGSIYAFEHCLTLPLYHEMTLDDQMFVIKSLLQIMGAN